MRTRWEALSRARRTAFPVTWAAWLRSWSARWASAREMVSKVLGQFGVPGAVEAVESGLGGVADLPVGAGAVLGGGEAVFGVSCLAEDVLGVSGLGIGPGGDGVLVAATVLLYTMRLIAVRIGTHSARRAVLGRAGRASAVPWPASAFSTVR